MNTRDHPEKARVRQGFKMFSGRQHPAFLRRSRPGEHQQAQELYSEVRGTGDLGDGTRSQREGDESSKIVCVLPHFFHDLSNRVICKSGPLLCVACLVFVTAKLPAFAEVLKVRILAADRVFKRVDGIWFLLWGVR